MSRLISQLSIEIGMRETDVRQIIQSAPIRYKHYKIPKRSGGWRLIAQPAREVKSLQRALLEIFLLKLPVHPAATAYRPGTSILANALPHAKSGPILKLDFKDFFPSIEPLDWKLYCRLKGVELSPEEIELTGRLLFHRAPGNGRLRLAIGAPSSPQLSNVLLFDFDELVTNGLLNDRVIYTRYADDMTFSAPRTGFLTGVEKTVRGILRDQKSPALYLNADKRVEATNKYRRSITGLIVTNDGKISIGKAKKRMIHAAVHKASLGQLDAPRMQRLCGWLAYINSVEPGFIDVLRRRYGAEAVSGIQKVVVYKKAETDFNPDIDV